VNASVIVVAMPVAAVAIADCRSCLAGVAVVAVVASVDPAAVAVFKFDKCLFSSFFVFSAIRDPEHFCAACFLSLSLSLSPFSLPFFPKER
jgi:hypothetical protein